MNEHKLQKGQVRSRIAIGFVIVLAVMLAVNLFELQKDLKYTHYQYVNELSTMEFALRQCNYPELLKMIRDNRCDQETTLYDTTEYAAIAYYYEAASYAHVYQTAGNEMKAGHYLSHMKEYRDELTSERFVALADSIDAKFELSKEE